MAGRKGTCRASCGGLGVGDNPLGKSRHRWEDNIKMNFKEVGRGGMDWIHLAQDMER